jgi:CheY-like chemotaxis protein
LPRQSSTIPNPEHRTAATVLVVEDEALLRVSLVDILRDEGFGVVEAASAHEAITILQTTTPVDIVMTDVRMPGTIDGVGLARFIRAHRPALKIIMTSGNLVASPAGCPVDRFIRKPYGATDVVRLIRSLSEHGETQVRRCDER